VTRALGVPASAAGRETGVRVGAVYEPNRSADEVAARRADWRHALDLTRTS
jgi:hypothetical protein